MAGPSPDTFLSIDKLMLFGILYTESTLDSRFGNQAKALLFYHLLNDDDIIGHIHRHCKRLKRLLFIMFELAQAHLELDVDGRQRIYFREGNSEYDHTYLRLLNWLYTEF